MISETRCDCCDLPVYSCGKAKETRLRQEWKADRSRLEARGWLSAIYPGVCEQCRERFEPGTLIRMVAHSGWRAECCAEVAS